MPLKGFYFACGDDVDLIEQKWLPDLQRKLSDAMWLRYDATIDNIVPGELVSEYYSNDLFSTSKVIVIRNAESKGAEVMEFLEEIITHPISDNTVVIVDSGWNKTTKLGRLIKEHFIAREFFRPEVKPFDLLDALNTKATLKVLRYSNTLFDNDYNALAIFSLLFGHFLLLRQVKALEGKSVDAIAQETKQHRFRIQKAMPACRFWSKPEIDKALLDLAELDKALRTWQYDEKMLIQMSLIKLTL